MTAAIAYLPNLAQACDRINARAKAENIATERAEAIKLAKRIIDKPGNISDDQLREVCAAFMAISPTADEKADNYGLYYLRADAHIDAINRREWQARNCPRPETSAQIVWKNRRSLLAVMTGWLVAALVVVLINGSAW